MNYNALIFLRTFCVLYLVMLMSPSIISGQTEVNASTLIKNVNIFNGKSKKLLKNQYVLIEGNTIKSIGTTSPTVIHNNTIVIDGSNKTLIPGLIDMHVHMIFGALTMSDLLSPDLNEEKIISLTAVQAEQMLMRGFTSVRDAGGPVFSLKAAIDKGSVNGPRIWPSGAMISQTSGHGDLRTPAERSRRFFGPVSRAELYGASFIADGRDEVLTAVRENLRQGASQIKIMAGGGTSSAYDPVDVTQYTFDEMRAAVEAAEDWGTYVMVHAYTPRAVKRAIKAGVKCIEHGQLLDKSTLKLVKRKKVWLSCQNLVESSPDMDPLRLKKRQPVIEGQKKIWPLAKKMKIKLAWGTDFLFEPHLLEQQNEYLIKLDQWFTPFEILKMVTYDNAQLLALSGLRSPYSGLLGRVEEGALADLILVDGNPLDDIKLLANPRGKFVVIVKDGQIVKNILQ